MSRKGNCYDNAMMESWHSLLKKELIYLTKFRSREEAERAIFADIEIFYNRERFHGALDYQTPAEAEAAYHERHGYCLAMSGVHFIDIGPPFL